MLDLNSMFKIYDDHELRNLIEAHNLIIALKNDGISLEGKKVLDIGCGLGHKSAEMTSQGAEVYGVEPIDSRFAWAIRSGKIYRNNIFNCRVQDLPIEMLGMFDIITMFAYRIIPMDIVSDYFPISINLGYEINKMQLEVTKSIGNLLKPNGELIIEFYNNQFDAYLHSPEKHCTPLMLQIQKGFGQSCYADLSNDGIFIKASSVRPEDIAKTSIEDVSTIDLNRGKPTFYLQSELTKQGCYYNGKYANFVWDISADYETIVYSITGTSEKERKLKLEKAEWERKHPTAN